MRPHALRMTAFGPYAGTVSVDLDALAGSGLFLLHGPTGAGKSTLLDGIGFALFGRVPGVRNAAKRLRSDHADPALRTEVQLEATLSGRRLRVTRSPQQERAKARGTGTTTEQAKVLLEERVGDAWVTVSTRVGEADAELADLVGMSAEQFFQVVLLPQGEFAQFLRASSADRAAVLQRLFATERFADVEGWLATRRRTCAERAAAARDAVAQVVARLAEVAGEDPVDQDEATWARDLLAAAVVAEQDGAVDVQAATATRDAARAEAEQAARLAGLQDRRRRALARREELDRELPVREALQAELDAAARAAEVAGVLGQVTTRRQARESALAAEAQARAALDGLLDGLLDDHLDDRLGDRLADPVALRAAALTARERCGRLEALRAVEQARREAVDEAALARSEAAGALTEVAEVELALAALPARKDGVAGTLARAQEAAQQLPAVQARRDQLAALRPDAVALSQVQARVRGLQEELLAARESALALEVKAHELRVASINSMVAQLAFRLEEGVPCEVCGSPVHPDPSRLRDEGVSADDEQRARRAADDAQAVVAGLQERLAAEQARAEQLADRLGTWTAAALDAELAGLDLELGVLAATADRLLPVRAELADLEAHGAELATRQVAAAAKAEAAERRADGADARAAAAARELAAVLTAGEDLDAALRRAAAAADAADAAVAAGQALARATAELDLAVAAAEAACREAGFDGPEAALAAARTPTWREQAADRLRTAADAAAAVAAELADPALDVPLEPAAPVVATAQALAEADAALAAVQEQLGERRQRRAALERLVPALAAELAALAPLEQQAREVRALADLCAGQGANTLRMTLTSFVLAARLEEVAEAASTRLLRMTQGRYALVHTDGAARGGSRSGLGLLARDSWSGQDRDTATLSGGETFLASLALALGLADVVAAEAGGARVGCLFVDEGFGTLDEDTLDEVMDVLDGLREGGRVVGLVSHVAELRQRIPAQLQVRKTRTGSDVVLHGC